MENTENTEHIEHIEDQSTLDTVDRNVKNENIENTGGANTGGADIGGADMESNNVPFHCSYMTLFVRVVVGTAGGDLNWLPYKSHRNPADTNEERRKRTEVLAVADMEVELLNENEIGGRSFRMEDGAWLHGVEASQGLRL